MITNEMVRCADEATATLKLFKPAQCLPANWAQTEHQLRKAKVAAEESARNYASFLANMSHELRTPLNAILGFSELLMIQDGKGDGAAQNLSTDGYARHIHIAGRHLLALINDILDISKINAEKLELQEHEITLESLFESAESMIRQRAQKFGVHFQVKLPQPQFTLWADGRRVGQALLNLLSNAIKSTPEGGRITLDARLDCLGAAIITVHDNGIGMLADEIPKALSEYGQLKNGLAHKHDGTGLGLPLSKRLVELHGGTLQLASTPGLGTTATIRLPRERVMV